MSYWSNGNAELDAMLERMQNQFRAGSRISVFFSIGFFLALQPEKEGDKEGLRIEKSFGFSTTIADAQKHKERLMSAFSFFGAEHSVKESIAWASNNIMAFGDWTASDSFTLRSNKHTLFKVETRGATSAEKAFFAEKFKNPDYCTSITKDDYYVSDAWKLRSMPKVAASTQHLSISM